MKETLPLPPTTNQIYHIVRKGKYYSLALTQEAVAWKQEAQYQLKIDREPISAPVEVRVTFYLHYRRDVDNLKILMDALQGTVIDNDDQVQELHIYKRKDFANPRVELEVLPCAEITSGE